MKLSRSPFTVKFLKEAKKHYQETGLFWGALTIFSACFIVTKDKWLIMKFGSSISADTMIYYKADGLLRYEPIKTLEKDWKEGKLIEIMTLNRKGRKGKVIWSRVSHVWNHGFKQVSEIECHGKKIEITGDHSLFTSPWINSHSKLIECKGSEIQVGTKLATIENYPIEERRVGYDLNLLSFYGLWLADGSYETKMTNGNFSCVTIACLPTDESETALVKSIAGKIGKNYSFKKRGIRIHSAKLVREMQERGFIGNSHTKRVPKWTFLLSKEEIAAFLRGYFQGDGTFTRGRRVACSSVSLDLLRDVQLLLNRFGIVSTITRERKPLHAKIGPGNEIFRLSINRLVSLKKFREIGFLSKPFEVEGRRGWCKDREVSIWRVNSKKDLGKKEVFDLEVPGYEAFVANGFLCHNSGAGKTISDKVALEAFGERLNPLTISGRFTPAGMAKIMKRAETNSELASELERFKNAKLIFVEDLSRCTTHYLKLTSLQFLAGLTKNTALDDLTSDGGTFGGNLGAEPKKCMVAGTPSDWEEISSTSLYNEFIDRRSLTGITLMSLKEWASRETMAKNAIEHKEDWQIILEWKDIIKQTDITPYLGPISSRDTSPHRQELYSKLAPFKRFPENVFGMIDSLAEGHARINGRDQVLPEDYELIDKLFSRFLVTADMKKKELFIVEELVRMPSGTLTLDALSYRLRKRARTDDLPDLNLVIKTICNYVDASKYLTKTRGSRSNPVIVSLSQSLLDLFNGWEREVTELINT